MKALKNIIALAYFHAGGNDRGEIYLVSTLKCHFLF